MHISQFPQDHRCIRNGLTAVAAFRHERTTIPPGATDTHRFRSGGGATFFFWLAPSPLAQPRLAGGRAASGHCYAFVRAMQSSEVCTPLPGAGCSVR